MGIKAVFEEKVADYIGKDNNYFGEGMQKLFTEVKQGAENHLKLVGDQLPEYDAHDKLHSEEIIKIIELLLGDEIIKTMSIYELFYIYLSAYTHDCGMALPNWELKILIETEGTKEFHIQNQIGINNDLKKPMSLTEAINIVKEKKDLIYGEFNKIKEYFFINCNEEYFIRDLAERLKTYQEFRNGFSNQIEEYIKSDDKIGFKSYSESLRSEFIRITHAERSALLIENLETRFISELGGNWGGAIARDLADICKAHGKDIDFIKKLGTESLYFGKDAANVQFISLLLRLGDIIHFSFDRAPKSLFAEKMIESEVSMKHWKAKIQGLNYSITADKDTGEKEIKYMLYCDEPDLYYFVLEYLDWVDLELAKFNFFQSKSENKSLEASLYRKVKFPSKVDRRYIKYNNKVFMPANNKGFVLEQNKIIQLLMGVGLYKDKDLFLRELYQNSLDACRLMIAIKKQKQEIKIGHIEFGLKEEILNGVSQKYLYCLDNGTGMTKNIVESYFLNIGNSYYSSQEYYRNSIRWGSEFKPVSKFGIGILSCFMVADLIDITTVAIDSKNPDDQIRFVVNGLGQYFYYLQPDPLDLEMIGDHGTLIKIFLKDNEIFNDENIENVSEVLYGLNSNDYQNQYKYEYVKWKRNILIVINSIVGLTEENLEVKVNLCSGKKDLISWDMIYPYQKTVDNQSKKLLFERITYLSDSYKPYIEFYENMDMLENLNININSDNFTIYTHITLPKKGIKHVDFRILDFPDTVIGLRRNALIDGISINKEKSDIFIIKNNRNRFFSDAIINFNGKIKPELSIDRSSITFMPDDLEIELKTCSDKFIETYIENISKYIEENEFNKDSDEVKLIWEYLMFKYESMAGSIIEKILKDEKMDVILPDISRVLHEKQSIISFYKKNKIILEKFVHKDLNQISMHILVGKSLNAEEIKVNAEIITLSTQTYDYRDLEFNGYGSHESYVSFLPLVIKVDEWKGKYHEYDIVSDFWPFVPERTFDAIKEVDTGEVRKIEKRGKRLSSVSNGLTGIAHLKAALINPHFGISTLENDPYRKKTTIVGAIGNTKIKYSLFEIYDWDLTHDDTDYSLYVFISPETLGEQDRVLLEDYKENDSIYYNGVKNGWSILFMGMGEKPIIKPGIVDRNDMIPDSSKSFWERNTGKTFYFLDGVKVEQKK